MKIKHSKFKNTGLIYEILVKQLTSDLVSRKDSPAVEIIKKYFSGENELMQEYQVYKTILEEKNVSTIKADNLINAALKTAGRIDHKKLSKLKYNLISEIKEHYDLDSFFSTDIKDYKTLAAFYCLLEAERSVEPVDPKLVVTNKTTLLEHMTGICEKKNNSTVDEYSDYDKDLRLLVFKLLLEKYNAKYSELLREQKELLRAYISTESVKELQSLLNNHITSLTAKLLECKQVMPRCIERIKLTEAMKTLQPLSSADRNIDKQLVNILQFYDLLYEFEKTV